MKQTVFEILPDDLETCGHVWSSNGIGTSLKNVSSASHGGEPCLNELIDDDVMAHLLTVDRVERECLASLIEDTRDRLGL